MKDFMWDFLLFAEKHKLATSIIVSIITSVIMRKLL